MTTQGTLSELRTTPANPIIDTTVIKVVEPPVEDGNPTMVAPPPPAPITEPSPKPDLTVKPEHIKEMKCRFCSAYAIANLAFRFSLVVFVLALSFNVLKTGNKNV